jgi:hypothetical protein
MATATYYAPLDRTPVELASGQPVAPGESVELDGEAIDANKDLIESGALLAVPKESTKAPTKGGEGKG